MNTEKEQQEEAFTLEDIKEWNDDRFRELVWNTIND